MSQGAGEDGGEGAGDEGGEGAGQGAGDEGGEEAGAAAPDALDPEIEQWFAARGLPDLKPAERLLLRRCPRGEPTVIAGRRPTERREENWIRPELIRRLATHDCPAAVRPSARGLRLDGAWIDGAWIDDAWIDDAAGGALDCESATLPAPLLLGWCHIAAPVILRGARTQSVNFTGCRLAAQAPNGAVLSADGLTAEGDVFLRSAGMDRFEAAGAVRLLGAQIGGDLICIGGRFDNEGGEALAADRAKVTGGVFLSAGYGHPFHATGAVRLLGAEIGGNLNCTGGRFDTEGGKALSADRAKVTGDVSLSAGDGHPFHATGAVRLVGAEIGGNLTCTGGRFDNEGGKALSAQRAKVTGALILRERPRIGGEEAPMVNGDLDLTAATVGTLVDEPDCWPQPGALLLDGCNYDRISSRAMTARERARWINLQDPKRFGQIFWAQPWRRLEHVFESVGDTLEARRVAVYRERARRKAGKVGFGLAEGRWSLLKNLLFWRPVNAVMGLLHRIYGFFTGYGYFTLRAVIPIFLLWGLGVAVYSAAWTANAIAPPSPYVLQSQAWTACVDKKASFEIAADCWSAAQKPGERYYPFNAGLYSFDVLLPILTIEQEEYWAPSPRIGGWVGSAAWVFRIFQEIMGYVLSALILAGLSRLIRER